MDRATPRIALLALLFAAACETREWVQTKPEPEGYPFESAHKICHSWAETYARKDDPPLPTGPSPDRGKSGSTGGSTSATTGAA